MSTWYDNPSMEYAPKVTISFQVVGVSRKDGRFDVEYIHHLLETMHVPSVPLPHLGGAGEPSVFLATRSLVQLDEHSLISNVSRTIPGKCGRRYKLLYGTVCISFSLYFTVSISRMLLKRKVWKNFVIGSATISLWQFDQSNLQLPNSKRLCLEAKENISVGVVAQLSACQAATTHLIKQLTRSGIVHHMIHHEAHMGTVVHVIQLPFTSGCDWESYQLLSNRLQSCEIRWCDGKWIVKVFIIL